MAPTGVTFGTRTCQGERRWFQEGCNEQMPRDKPLSNLLNFAFLNLKPKGREFLAKWSQLYMLGNFDVCFWTTNGFTILTESWCLTWRLLTVQFDQFGHCYPWVTCTWIVLPFRGMDDVWLCDWCQKQHHPLVFKQQPHWCSQSYLYSFVFHVFFNVPKSGFFQSKQGCIWVVLVNTSWAFWCYCMSYTFDDIRFN